MNLIGQSAPNPQIGMVVRGLVKHLSRSPIADDEIRAAVEWAQSVLNGIVAEEAVIVPPMPDLPNSLTGV